MRFLSGRTHTIIGLLTGITMLLAPNLFGFSDVGGVAVTLSRIVGIFIILSELITTSELSLVKLVPLSLHLVTDYLTGVFLALSPWLFGFANQEANAWVPHLLVGLFVVGYALVTNPNTGVIEESA